MRAKNDTGIAQVFDTATGGCRIVTAHRQLSAPRTKLLLLLALFLMMLLMGPLSAQSQSVYCVRSGAIGANDGSDWINAYTSLPATLQRGATYYVADGSYSAYTFNTPESGTSLVTIKKATIADHGTGIGWQSSYGDGQAQFVQYTVSKGYLVIDGANGGGPGSWKSGHGFKITNNYARLLYFSTSVTNVTVRHVEFAFPTSEVDDSLACDHIYSIYQITNFTLEYCYLHDSSRVFILSRAWKDVLVQYNCFARNRSTAGRHAEGWSDHDGVRYIVRNNIWEDIEGTGLVVMLYGSAYDWEIYGNVVYWTGNPNYSGFGNGTFTTRSADAYAYNWKIYNNTVVDGKGINTFHAIYNGSGNLIKNNIWYNSPLSTWGAGTDYNWYIQSGSKNVGSNDVSDPTSADPFVDLANGDFRLKAASPSGVNVKEADKQFHIDPNTITRGDDGVWDRGTFEYASAVKKPAAVNLYLSP